MEYLYAPFIIQGLLMGIDEILHKKRGLGLWERLGHPLDTLTVFVAMSFIALNEYSDSRLTIFIILAIFSCIFITKDEIVHSQECGAFENWLHAVLFVLHPVIFFASGIIWKYHPSSDFLVVQAISVGVFMCYQIVKWSIPWKKITK